MQKTALDRYEEIVIDALKSSSTKLHKSFKTAIITTLILYMVIPRKINFTQMGRYSDSCEQRFRQLFERGFDWMKFNTDLMWQAFGRESRKAIAIDASYISKAGNKTPYIGKFWSGCAGMMKRGLEILGIGIVDVDIRDCMMLRACQTANTEEMAKRGEGYNLVDWYLDALRTYKENLLAITNYVVADAWFSKARFVDGLLEMVNVAKVVRRKYYPSLSIGLLKTYMSDIWMLKRILARCGISPNRALNAKLVKELFGLVADAG